MMQNTDPIAHAFSDWIGAQIESVTKGSALVTMVIKPEHVNNFGTAHGGILNSLADLAFELASNSHGIPALALHTNMQYYKPAFPKDVLTAKATENHLGKSTATYTVRVTRDEELIATFTGTVFRKQPE